MEPTKRIPRLYGFLRRSSFCPGKVGSQFDNRVQFGIQAPDPLKVRLYKFHRRDLAASYQLCHSTGGQFVQIHLRMELLEEVSDQLSTVRSKDAFWMKLHAFYGKLAMTQSHDHGLAVLLAMRGDLELLGQAFLFHDE